MLTRAAPGSVCLRCERLALAQRTRAFSTAPNVRLASPTSSSPPIKARNKARNLPESQPGAPFSLQPAVVDAAFANARRRKFPVHEEEWRRTLQRARAELPTMADEIARLKKALSRDPRKAAAAATSTAAADQQEAEAQAQSPAELKQRLRALTAEHEELLSSSLDVRLRFPNGTHAGVPLGPEPNARIVGHGDPRGLLPEDLRAALQEKSPCTVAELPTPASTSSSRAHTDIAALLPHALFPSSSTLDQASGALTTGASFPFLLGPLAALSHALAQYALRTCASHGFLLVRAPDIVRADLARRCGFMPRDEGEASQTYFVSSSSSSSSSQGHGGAAGSPELCLAGTAEIPLAGLCAERTFFLQSGGDKAAAAAGAAQGGPFVPLKLCALGSAFRAEAGARGADTKGLYRVHQFDKVEMFVVAPAQTAVSENGAGVSAAATAGEADPFAAEDADMSHLDELRAIQEEIISGLGLPYRVLDMPSEELGASACRKYDIEAWMPGRGSWGEVSSASHCTTFQSRRLNIRYRRSPGAQGKLEYAHTLNATAAAMPRLIVALLENFGAVEADGGRAQRLRLPEVLRPFWIGAEGEVEWVEMRGDKVSGNGSLN
ncbi:Serine--tRNA ligase, mitochondrial [Tilletia horrida]|nr:Serine--tRNA ligase, mitochondrial [Tilletia horrida]